MWIICIHGYITCIGCFSIKCILTTNCDVWSHKHFYYTTYVFSPLIIRHVDMYIVQYVICVCICSERALALYILYISLGGRQVMYTKRLEDSVVSRARPHGPVVASSCVIRGDSRLCLESDTRASQSMLCT